MNIYNVNIKSKFKLKSLYSYECCHYPLSSGLRSERRERSPLEHDACCCRHYCPMGQIQE